MQKENTMTVGRWCGRWFIANRHKWDGNTEGGYRNLIYSHILPSIGSTVSEAVSAPHTKASLITYENNKLRTRYAEYLKARELPPSGSDISITDTIAEITTDDERIVLYYILHENVIRYFCWSHFYVLRRPETSATNILLKNIFKREVREYRCRLTQHTDELLC